MILRPPADEPLTQRITELEHPTPQQVKQLQIVAQLTEAVGRALDLEDIYEAALDGLQRSLGAQRASILLYDPDGVMRFKAWRGLSDSYRSAVEGHSPWTPDTVDPEPILVSDVILDPALAPFRDTITGEGIRALGFIPLVSRDVLIGKFMVYFDQPHVFEPEEVRMVRTIAGHVAFAVDRRRSEEKLALYREIFANSSEAIAILDAQGYYLEQNQAHRALTGFEDHELRGCTPAIHLGEAQFVEIVGALAARGVYQAEVESVTKSGERHEIELSAFTVRDPAGAPLCFVGIQRDIRERKRAERALRFLAESSAALDRSLDYDATVAQLAELVVPRLADWTIVDLVQGGRLVTAATRHADAERDEALGALVAQRGCVAFPLACEVFESGEAKALPNAAAILTSRFASDDLARVLNELSLRSVMVVPLKAHERVLGVVTMVATHRSYQPHDLALAEDFAGRAAAALENARLYREAQESDRRKEEFLAVLSHELRNPLAPIMNSVELIRMAHDPELLQRSHAIMERQVRNLKRLVDDLLDVSRITRGKVELKKQRVDLETIVRHALETSRPCLEERELRVTSEIERGVLVEADPLRIEQVLTNLLSNASKYTPLQGAVRITVKREGGHARVTVKDSGEGIEPELLGRVFDLFVQGRPPSNAPASGLGIGLTLARGLTELHGGTMEVTSDGAGRGSEFTVRLPLSTLDRASEGDTSGAVAMPRALRVLVVDDNEDAATGMVELLRIKGHDAYAAHSGVAALECAAAQPPDVVILDITLPDLDGFEVAERIRASSENPALQIIAISGYGPDQFKRESASPFTRHLVKPVDWEKLGAVLAG